MPSIPPLRDHVQLPHSLAARELGSRFFKDHYTVYVILASAPCLYGYELYQQFSATTRTFSWGHLHCVRMRAPYETRWNLLLCAISLSSMMLPKIRCHGGILCPSPVVMSLHDSCLFYLNVEPLSSSEVVAAAQKYRTCSEGQQARHQDVSSCGSVTVWYAVHQAAESRSCEEETVISKCWRCALENSLHKGVIENK